MQTSNNKLRSPLEHAGVLRLHSSDNVFVARRLVGLGEELGPGQRARAQVQAGHKLAARPIAAGELIRKYDTVIGVALRNIDIGDHVHTHNMAMTDYYREPAFSSEVHAVDFFPAEHRATFEGYVRDNGKVATRNFIGVISSVNCSATVARHIAEHFTPERLSAYPNVDGVVAFVQTSGCGLSTPSYHLDVLRRTLAGYARHPNLAGVLMIGLGCERSQMHEIVESQGLVPGDRLRTMLMQDIGGTRATIAKGVALIEEMLPAANRATRQTVSAEHLKVGLECGGSDGLSGISANPALGAAVDILVRHGGTAILSETPEIHGV